MAAPDHRVCVEFLPPRDLGRPEVVRLLRAHGVAPMLAVRPGDDDAALEALRPYVDAGLPACAWPLLDDADGYWASESNAVLFAARVDALLAAARSRRAPLPWVAVDLEPRLEELRGIGSESFARLAPRLCAQAVRHLDEARFARATAVFAALHKRIAAAGARALAVTYPFVSADFKTGGSAIQDLCEAPLGCGWDRVALMTYGSLIAGYSRGLLSVEDVRWYGFRALGRLAAVLGARAGAFLGLVGRGKLGDEPCYDDPRDLALDAAAARMAGVGEVSLFGLEGLLDRPDPERWLAALTALPPAAPPFRARGELLHRSIEAGASALALLRALGA